MILRADHPDDHVIGAISRADKRRAATATVPWDVPAAGDCRGICWSDAESRQDRVAIVIGPERDIGALFGSICDGRLDDSTAGTRGEGYGGTDPAEDVSINQVCIAVLAQCNYQVRRRCIG